MRARGKGPFQFGKYELKGTLNWRSLVFAVAVAGVTWGSAELVPYLEAQEGIWATVAGVTTVVLRAAREWLKDNELRVR